MKVEIAQISTLPGRIEENTQKIIESIRKAKKDGADLVVFPELAVPGYMSLDLLLSEQYLKRQRSALIRIINATPGISAIVGFVDYDEDKNGPDGTHIRYNSAAAIEDGKLKAVIDKTLLPNYDVFDESRYFQTARRRRVAHIAGHKVGIEICEDLWDPLYPIKVSDELVSKGAEVLVNISASPFYIDKCTTREALVKNKIEKNKVPFVYVNLVGVQDGFQGELVFDGQSMSFNNKGGLIGIAKAFQEETLLVDLDNSQEIDHPCFPAISQLYHALVFGIKGYFERTNFQRTFIGISGGIDSAVVAALATEALGKDNVTGVAMPSRYTSKESLQDARDLAENLGIKLETISIEDAFVTIQKGLEKSFGDLPFDTTEENIQARLRGLILMAHANKFKGLVLNTGNKTETALGYSTLYGDMCGGLGPISDVSKQKIYELANYINTKQEKPIIPFSIIRKKPTAELRDNQTDEESLGLPYEILSPLVDEMIEDNKTIAELKKRYPKAAVEHIFSLIKTAEYKRRQAPPGIKVTKKSFGIGRRFPIAY